MTAGFLLPRVLLPQSLGDAAAAAMYVPNLVLAQRGTDYLADTTPSLFQHFWSLGVEEQFYLVWPLLLLAVFAIARPHAAETRRRRMLLPAVLAAVAVLSLALCLYESTVAEPWAFFPMWTRAWQFACGAGRGCCCTCRCDPRQFRWRGDDGCLDRMVLGTAQHRRRAPRVVAGDRLGRHP
jgi:peptidoglycan/LPS O-acetylase OafA/YrhL